MEIVRNADGTLVVPVEPGRMATMPTLLPTSTPYVPDAHRRPCAPSRRGRLRRSARGVGPQQNPEPVVSTATGRRRRWRRARGRDRPITRSRPRSRRSTIPRPSGEALRHVLVGGVHSVEDFASEVAEAEGGEALPAHEATKIIGEVLAELD